MAETELSQGAAIVAGLVRRLGASAIARKLECGESLVRAHALGERTPRPAMRARYQDAFDVPAAAWDASPHADARAPRVPRAARRAKEPSSGNGSVGGPAVEAPAGSLEPNGEPLLTAAELERDVREIRAEIAAAKVQGAGAREIASLRHNLTSTLRLLSRLRGEGQVTTSQILRSPQWSVVVEAIHEWLASVSKRFPGAGLVGELNEILKRIEVEGRAL